MTYSIRIMLFHQAPPVTCNTLLTRGPWNFSVVRCHWYWAFTRTAYSIRTLHLQKTEVVGN